MLPWPVAAFFYLVATLGSPWPDAAQAALLFAGVMSGATVFSPLGLATMLALWSGHLLLSCLGMVACPLLWFAVLVWPVVRPPHRLSPRGVLLIQAMFAAAQAWVGAWLIPLAF